MRGVRSLSGLAGANASLKDAGAGGGAGGGIQHVFSAFEQGDSIDPNYATTMDLTGAGIQSGDLLIAVVYTDGWFGNAPGDTYGVTGITTSGWTEERRHEPSAGRGAILYLKVADGNEAEVACSGARVGGIAFSAVRGVAYPSATDISNATIAFTSPGSVYQATISAMVGGPYDAVGTFCGPLSSHTPIQISKGAAAGATGLNQLGGSVVRQNMAMTIQLLSGADAYGALALTRSQYISSYFLMQLGLSAE